SYVPGMTRVSSAIPTDILEEIFEWICVDRQVPSIRLALVCRRWREILLGLPTVWRTVEIDLKSKVSIDDRLRRLERRLKLAKGLTLDVVLSNTCRYYGLTQDEYSHLFRILVKLAPIERWYSLWLEEGASIVPNAEEIPIGEKFPGRFISPRILTARGYSSQGPRPHPHIHLFQRILESDPLLEHLCTMGNWFHREMKLQTFTRLLRGLKTFTTYPGLLLKEQYEALPSSCELGINPHWFINQDFTLLLPKTTNIHKFIPTDPRRMDLSNVVTLRISLSPCADGVDESLDLPNLQILEIRPCLPQYLQIFKAPKLERLALFEPYQYSGAPSLTLSRREIKPVIAPLFRQNRHLVVMNPTSFTIDLDGIAGRAFIVMLEAWPRLKHLSMTIGNDFDLFGLFTKRLLDEASPLCPDLETMLIETWWYRKSRQWRRWRETAKQLMVARKNGPLDTIIWRNRWFGAEFVRRSDDI
ncbi:hypothetical protein FRC17_009354, partial [Serendipita sp. 399]